MHRRAFLKFLLAAPASLVVADVAEVLWTPKPMVTVPELPALAFHRDAFTLVMSDMDLADMQRRYNYYRSAEAEMLALRPKAPFVMYDRQAGVSMRFIEQYEISEQVTRWDILAALPVPE